MSAPVADEDSTPFWHALRKHRILLQRCSNCSEIRFPPMPGCPHCGSGDAEHVTASGQGRIYSWIVVRRPMGSIAADQLPCTIATVELDEGCRVLGRLTAGVAGVDIAVTADYVERDGWTELAFVTEQQA